jgi:hypothetical protein
VDEGLASDLVGAKSVLGMEGKWMWMRLTDGTLLTARETALERMIIAPQITNAVVGLMSKSLGQRARKNSSLRCVWLYTASVSAEVARMVMADRRARTVRPRRVDSIARDVRTAFW